MPKEAVLVRIEVLGSFLVGDGAQASLVALPSNAGLDAECILSRQASAISLVQRGFGVLHASAVVIGDTAVAFLGDSGAGKSTVAAALCSRGHGLLADDLVTIEPSQLQIVEPLREPLRLHNDVLAALAIVAAPLKLVDGEKREFPAEMPPDPVGFRSVRIYVLADSHEFDQVRIETLESMEALYVLMRHSPAGALARLGASAVNLSALAAIARDLPVRRLVRPRKLALLANLAAAIEEDCRRARAYT